MTETTKAATVPDGVPVELWQSAGHELFEWVTQTFVVPEIARRVEAGEMAEGQGIYAAQVLFWVDRPPEVRFDREVQGRAEITAPSVEQRVGAPVALGQVESLRKFVLSEEDADAAHVTLFVLKDAVNLVFNGAYSAASIEKLLVRADEFLESTRLAADAGHAGPFVELGFATTEMLVKAELMSLPERRVHHNKKHTNLNNLYNQWARLGNTQQRFADLLNRLTKLRKPGRYGEGELNLSGEQIGEDLEILEALRAHVEEVRPKQSLDSEGRSRLNAIAVHPLRQGEVVDGKLGYFC